MHDTPDWHWGLSNSSKGALSLWLEPWADEVEVPSKSTVTMRIQAPHRDHLAVEVEATENHLVVWGSGGQRIEVFVDNVLQRTGSALIEVPEAFGLSTKTLLRVMFGDQPTARLGGSVPLADRWSFWQRMKHWLRV